MTLVSMAEFLTIKQVVAQYDISRRSIYNLREKKLLEFHHPGGVRKSYIRKSEFEMLMQRELVK
jgi:predicted DNA-binding transcriptional regulator AlpA